VEYHKDIYSVDVSASTWNWAEKEVQLKKLQDEFVQAVNRYVFRTGVRALEGLEEEGAGELLEGRSEDVKNAIMGLFLPLLPPPPRIVDVVRPAPLLPSSPGAANWWQPGQHVSQPHPVPVESWRVVPSTPSPTIATCAETQGSFLGQCGSERHPAALTDSFLQPAIPHHEPVLQFAPGHRSDTRPPSSERTGPAVRVKRREQWIRWRLRMGYGICTTVRCLYLGSDQL